MNMFNNMSNRIVFLILWLLILSEVHIVKSQENTVNFYYYSISENSFFEENVTGNQSNLLFTFIPPLRNIVAGPGWSPSGNWFAWTVVPEYEGAVSNGDNVYLGNIETQTVTPLDKLSDEPLYANASWSPNQDLLLVTQLNREQDKYVSETYLYDAPKGKDIYETDKIIDYASWSPSGDYVQLFYSHDAEHRNISIISANTLNEISITYKINYCGMNEPSWSLQNKFLYLTDNNQLNIYDMRTNESTSLPMKTDIIYHVNWDTSGKYALVWTSKKCGDFASTTDKMFDLWLLSTETQHLEYIAQTDDSWEKDPSQGSIWSDTGQYALIHHGQGMFSVLNVNTLSLLDLPPNTDSIVEARWFHNEDALLLLESGEKTNLYKYNIEDNVISFLLTVDNKPLDDSVHFSVSPNNYNVAYASQEESYLINIKLNNITSVYINDENSRSFTDVIWHSTGNWVFLIVNYNDSHFVSVAKSDGSQVRNLGYCTITKSCFGWLE